MKRLLNTISILKYSYRTNSDLFIASNVKLRKELTEKQLEGVKVAVLSDVAPSMVADILQFKGAQITHFNQKDVISSDKKEQEKSRLQKILRKTDILLCESDFHLSPTELSKKHSHLIVAETPKDCDKVCALCLVASIGTALFNREQSQVGQKVSNSSFLKFIQEMKKK